MCFVPSSNSITSVKMPSQCRIRKKNVSLLIAPQQNKTDLTHTVEMFEDAKGTLTLDLEFTSTSETAYLLEIAYPPLDELTALLGDGKGGYRIVETGDSKPFSQRDVEHQNFVFRLPAKLDGKTTVFLRIANRGAILLPMTLWKQPAFYNYKQTEQLAICLRITLNPR